MWFSLSNVHATSPGRRRASTARNHDDFLRVTASGLFGKTARHDIAARADDAANPEPLARDLPCIIVDYLTRSADTVHSQSLGYAMSVPSGFFAATVALVSLTVLVP